MQTYDDLDILAMLWLVMMAVFFVVVAIIAGYFDRLNKKLPNPQPMATCKHARWYRITTSRINDNER
jgi:hypothetical protein